MSQPSEWQATQASSVSLMSRTWTGTEDEVVKAVLAEFSHLDLEAEQYTDQIDFYRCAPHHGRRRRFLTLMVM